MNNVFDPHNVFNAGLTVINLAEFRKTFSTSSVLGIANIKKLPYADQDMLNIMCHERVYFLTNEWNFRVDVILHNLNLRGTTSHYNRIKKNVKVYHYAGNVKPWNGLNIPTEEAFWYYARRSPFYSAIFKRMLWEQSTNISYSMLGMQPKKSRKLLEKFMPNGTWVRKVMEKLFPLGSFQRIAVKKVINFVFQS
jgi:lipopolysaccharide biosynthesis glycosyltransferase